MTPASAHAVAWGDALSELGTDAQASIYHIKALVSAIDTAIDLMGSIDNEDHRASLGHISAYTALIAATAEKADAICIEVERRGYDARHGIAA
ncbi:hypothetical protein ACH0BU_04240 [Sphingomonas olei]